MRRLERSWLASVGILVCSACSLRSLDYLGPGPSGDQGGQAPSGKSGSGGQGGGAVGNGGGGGSSAASGQAGSENIDVPVPDCGDSAQTVDETDIDCGGRTCAPCDDDKKCLAGTDCASAICTNQVCQPPTCSDLAVNGDETDLNCGGGCPKCSEGQHCVDGDDCASNSCGEAVCFSPACSDGVLQEGCPLLVDNTPYSLAPAHAPSKCIDDGSRSVAEGHAMTLYTCKTETHQAFWTVAREDGYFAFRNGLSGKCLQVRDASMADGAVVEQGSCDYSPDQLWMPERVDDVSMMLRSKVSGLVLDVAGDNVGTNTQPIVQGAQTDSADTHWQLQKRTAGAHIALLPNSDKDLHVGHDEAVVRVTAEDDDESAHWRVVPGLDDPSGVSFQSRDDPGRYLRNTSFRIWSDTNDGSASFKRDATFRYVNPLLGSSSQTRGLEPSELPGHFLLRDGDTVRVAELVDSTAFRDAATWWLSPR